MSYTLGQQNAFIIVTLKHPHAFPAYSSVYALDISQRLGPLKKHKDRGSAAVPKMSFTGCALLLLENGAQD